MVLRHIPRAIGKLRLPLPPIIDLECPMAYTYLDKAQNTILLLWAVAREEGSLPATVRFRGMS